MTPTASTPFTPPTPHTHLRVRSSDSTRLNVEIHGPDDAPTVVLVHGWTCSIAFWAPVIRALPDLRVVAYDQRGHGKSDVPGQGHYSVQALVDDLEAVLEATLPNQQTAVLVGHSMGGMAVMAAGLSSGVMSRTSAVVLASTGCSNLMAGARIVPFATRSPKLGRALHRRLLYSALPLGQVNPMARAAIKYGTLSRTATKELAHATATIVHACPRASRAAWGRVLATVEVEAGARALDVPTAIIVGQEDRLTPPHHAQAIAQVLPQCRGLTELPNVGHMTPLEAPDAVATLIRSVTVTPASAPAPSPTPGSLT